MTALLIDTLMPDHDSAVVSTRVWDEPPALSIQAGTELDLLPNPIMATVGIVRPGPVRGRRQPVRFSDLLLPPLNWSMLAELPGQEIVAGQIRPLRCTGPVPAEPLWSDAASFREFSTPGYTKVAISLRAHPCGATSSILTVETRIELTDPSSRRQLRRSRLFAGFQRMRHGRAAGRDGLVDTGPERPETLAGEGSATP